MGLGLGGARVGCVAMARAELGGHSRHKTQRSLGMVMSPKSCRAFSSSRRLNALNAECSECLNALNSECYLCLNALKVLACSSSIGGKLVNALSV